MIKKLFLFVSIFSFFVSGVVFVNAQSTTQSEQAKPFFEKNISAFGTKKDEVKKLQGFLINQGLLKINGEPTGVYGSKTKSAVKELQKQLDIPATGTVGPITRAKLNDLILFVPSKNLELVNSEVKENTQTTASSDVAPKQIEQPEKILIKPNTQVAVVIPNPAIPRVMFWWGKVNQHINLTTGNWETDPDGLQPFAGASVDHLVYCKMFYPKTTSVVPYMYETISGWHDRGNVNNYTSTNLSYRCVQGDQVVVPTPSDLASANKAIPRVMFWWGKVNQHINLTTGNWETDPDGLQPFAGASVDHLVYCKMFYPKTTSVVPYAYEKIDGWHDRGNVNNYTSTNQSYRCVQEGEIVSVGSIQ